MLINYETGYIGRSGLKANYCLRPLYIAALQPSNVIYCPPKYFSTQYPRGGAGGISSTKNAIRN